jgi:hypothetical protein
VTRLYFRGDAAFGNSEMYEFLEAKGVGYTIRWPVTALAAQDRLALKRPVGPPPHELRHYYTSFHYQAQSWTQPCLSWPRSNGIPASFIPALASSSPTWRGQLSAWCLLQPVK